MKKLLSIILLMLFCFSLSAVEVEEVQQKNIIVTIKRLPGGHYAVVIQWKVAGKQVVLNYVASYINSSGYSHFYGIPYKKFMKLNFPGKKYD